MATQEEILKELGVGMGGGAAGVCVNSLDSNQLGNDEGVEQLWAMKAMEHSEIYFNLLCAVDPKLLHLTPKDAELYAAFKSEFPDFKIDKLCEESLKSPVAKEKWRPFCNKFQSLVEDFSFATLVRIDSSDEYSEQNSILVTRIQFFCIEIARNKEGNNDVIRMKFKPKARNKTST